MILTSVALLYGQPMGCSRYFVGLPISQTLFAIAGVICADSAFTAQLQRWGDLSITAADCKDKYLTYALQADDDWYDDDWVFNQLAQNDDRFAEAEVNCGCTHAAPAACPLS